ncbi:hypothetical protein MCOR02_000349 [Pyricularia oryzae]|uniref:Thioredoxin domain-containing protein n=1 Tax=Pyricularia oryzae TaxID=318829 RepID=A0A4P7NT50_PYROR|nr:hypothetical protein MCOR02_000349 [Pyricularia oryzae]KAI6301750.1 hypothetical protein MCOR34_008968 [Pyricularia oryzae]KAI6394883.1 hypothetical protein MCOR20_010396 [Pyricularia oryzae]KAI6457237.1 hypothetical protein MCOR17_007929 [Pyricularia oryzae]KAI6500674.1 hypothetical protein MCOR13_005886 [Pyricularia oryzae]
MSRRLITTKLPSWAALEPCLNATRQQPTQTCRRFLSSPSASSPSSRRPTTTPRRIQQQQTFVPRRWKSETVEELKSRNRSGPFSWKAGVIFVLTAAGLVWYMDHEKERMHKKRIADASKGVGKPRIGGAFELIDQDGRPFSSDSLKGRYSLVYFGFSHCPDICPEELDKMALMFDEVQKERPGALAPVFVTCDPERDTPEVLKEYLAEFHPDFIGLTGTYEQIKAMCKAYRVYFSTPRDVKPGQDYLVDHSIYFYLMDPEGDFVEALGRQHSPKAGANIILDHMKEYKGQLKTA